MNLSLRLVFVLPLAVSIGLTQPPPPPPAGGPIKAGFKDVIKANMYVDNWCMVYINGKLTMVDSIEFLPHNVISANILPEYPMIIAILAKDNADPNTGMEYGDHIGDAGFILKFSDGTVSNAQWKVKSFFRGPLNGDTRNPRVEHTPLPANWYAPDFDDSSWNFATEYTSDRVKPDGDYNAADFTGAKFIWTGDIDLDNTVVFRYTVPKPANWSKTWDADGDLDNSELCKEASLCQIPVDSAADAGLRILSAHPLDLGPDSAKQFLLVYGTGFRADSIASVDGVMARVSHVGSPPVPGLETLLVEIPSGLIGRSIADLTITVDGRRSNRVYVKR